MTMIIALIGGLVAISAIGLVLWKADKTALIWLRDKFAEWFAVSASLTLLWVAVACATAVLFIWDGVWATHQAPEGMELSYRAAGWALRIWTIAGLSIAITLARKGAMVSGAALLLTWLGTSVMTYGHAVGFMATGQMQRYESAQSVTETKDAVVGSKEEQNAEIDRQIEGVRLDRDADVAALESALNIELTDGKGGNDKEARDKYTQLISERRAQATAQIDQLNTLKLTNLQSKQSAKTTATTDAASEVAFDPLYIWIAHSIHGTEANESQIRDVASKVGAFWPGLLEIISGVGTAILTSAHMHFAHKSNQQPKQVGASQPVAGRREDEAEEKEAEPALDPANDYPDEKIRNSSRGGRSNAHRKRAHEAQKIAIPPELHANLEADLVPEAAE